MDERFPGSPGPDAPPPYLGGGAPGAGQVSERMQSLLSRAVEDQMAEQRQLQLLVNDIRASLAQLQEEVRQNAGAQSLEVVRGEVGGLGAEVRSSTAVIGERLEAVVRAVTASVQAVQSVSGQLERIHEQLGYQQQVMASLPATVQRAVAEGTADTAVRDELVALRAEIAQMRAATGELVRGEVGTMGHGVQSQVAELRAFVEREVTATQEASRSGTEALARQLTAHVDTAVMALVEALLRRRATGTTAAPSPAAEPVASLTGASGPQAAGHAGVTSAAAPRLGRPGQAASAYDDQAAGDSETTAAADEVSGDDLGHDLGHDPATESSPVGGDDAEEAQALAAEVFDDVATGLAEHHEDVPPPAAEPTTAEAVDALTAVALTTADAPSDLPDDAPEPDEATGGADIATDEPSDSAAGDDDSAPHASGATDGGGDDDDAEARLRWSAADDRPQAAFTMGRGWDSGRERERRTADGEPPAEDEGAEGRPERRRPWWRPGG